MIEATDSPLYGKLMRNVASILAERLALTARAGRTICPAEKTRILTAVRYRLTLVRSIPGPTLTLLIQRPPVPWRFTTSRLDRRVRHNAPPGPLFPFWERSYPIWERCRRCLDPHRPGPLVPASSRSRAHPVLGGAPGSPIRRRHPLVPPQGSGTCWRRPRHCGRVRHALVDVVWRFG